MSLLDHKSWLNVFFFFFLHVHQTSIKEEQEDEEICENYPYESPESTDEHGHSPEMNQEEDNGSPERPNLHFDRVPSLWLWGPSSPLTACVTLYSKSFQKQLLRLRKPNTLFLENFFFLYL